MSATTQSHLAKGQLIVPGVVIVLTVVLIRWQSPTAIGLLAWDGAPAAVLLATLVLAGTWVMPVLGMGRLPLRWQLLIGAGAGIGGGSMLVLALGVVGVVGRGTWLALLGVLALGAVAAVVRLRKDGASGTHSTRLPEVSVAHPKRRWLWVCVTPFLGMGFLVSVVPPGFLWEEEGGGYDVLEYHLQLPKEYLESGGIGYTPHNVYGSFPANVEMLYLLSMIVRGDVYAGAASAKILNALLGVWCVFAANVGGRETSRRVGVATAVLAGSVGWLTYLSGVAYVENGMLAFGMTAAACLVRAGRGSPAGGVSVVWVGLGGLMSGLACGCKYTAFALIAIPLAGLVAVMPWSSVATRCRGVTVFGLASLCAVAPWLIKNAAMTSNPVFPLANGVFDGRPAGWEEEETLRFAASHSPGPDESSLKDRVRLVWERIVGDRAQRFGPVVLVLALLRVIGPNRQRIDYGLALVLVMQLLGWMFVTHLYARFAVPLMIPLVLLGGRVFASWGSGRVRGVLTGALIAGVGFNVLMTAEHYGRHLYRDGQRLPLEGATAFFLEGMGGGHEHLRVINQSLPEDAYILMIGDAKAFYFQRKVDYFVVFNRNPFVEAVRAARDGRAIIDWLKGRGYSHVLVNWSEVRRLRRSRYGFPDAVNPGLFQELVGAGLKPIETFKTGDPPSPYAVLYEVPG